MATPSWPSDLQQYLNVDSFNYAFGDTLIRSDMDIGPAKVRRRFTRPIDMITGAIILPFSQFSEFKYFYNTTVNGGATQFYFTHPMTREQILVRFKDVPTISPIGGINFNVSFTLEVMP